MSSNAANRGPTRSLADAINKKRDLWTNIQWMRYEQARGNAGQHWVTDRESGQALLVSSSVGRRTFAPGSLVPVARGAQGRERFIVGEPPPGKQGAAAYSKRESAPIQFDKIHIEYADPDVLIPGVDDQDVALYGYGFREDPVDTFTAVTYDKTLKEWVDDTYITVHDPIWVSENEVQVQVDVSSSCPNPYSISIKVTRS